MNKPSPLPCKPQVARLPDGRIGVFMGAAYQFTDDAGATSLRDQLTQVLPAVTPRQHYEQAEQEYLYLLQRELEAFDINKAIETRATA